jgi:peptide/nickel transport system substrate-binding protein
LPEGWVFLDVLDDTVLTERFLSGQDGEPNFVFEPPANQFEALRNSDAQYFQGSGTVWHYFAMNLADPNSAANGFDEDGNYVEQAPHPIFGDVRVRQALQSAINIEEIILGAQNGDATAMVAGTIPSAFSIHPTLERRAFDLEAAGALLDEAGWTDADGDGTRECNGCMYAEEGAPMAFSLMNPQSSGREDVAVLIQAQFAEIGVEVEVQTLDFNGMYGALGAQTFDAAIAGWRGGVPFDPDQRSFFGTEQDIFSTTGDGYGFNFPSYQNPELDTLMEEVNLVPGCDLDARLEIAYQIQEILWEDQPYLWLYSLDSSYVAAENIGNFDPYAAAGRWNIDAWYVQQ